MSLLRTEIIFDLTGNFVNNLLKLIQQYLYNIIILKFKNFEIFIANFKKNIENS